MPMIPARAGFRHPITCPCGNPPGVPPSLLEPGEVPWCFACREEPDRGEHLTALTIELTARPLCLFCSRPAPAEFAGVELAETKAFYHVSCLFDSMLASWRAA